jgi:hypothetical protein
VLPGLCVKVLSFTKPGRSRLPKARVQQASPGLDGGLEVHKRLRIVLVVEVPVVWVVEVEALAVEWVEG